jgi:Mg2+-importing ATPase
VDEEELQKPRNWNMRLIGRFTAFFGGISSAFDFVTMGVLLYLAGSNIDLFRTGWFIESTMSEILVTFPIRTKKRFYASKPGKILILTSIVFGLLTVLLPYSQFNKLFEFHPPDPNILILIACILVLYFAVAESVKQFFYKRIL